MGKELLAILFLLSCLSGAAVLALDSKSGESSERSYVIRPVGTVEIDGDETLLRIDEEYEDALKGLDEFSHVLVFYWFHKNDTPEKRSILQVHPRGDPRNPLTGVFATRSPVRPNLMALTVCEILSVKDNVICVDKIDALPGSPIVDLKPYIPACDSVPDAKVPAWVHSRAREGPPPGPRE
jgi:tRNA-Thr(GGU) m(6)t(6)A37 methyltransferase TsaA